MSNRRSIIKSLLVATASLLMLAAAHTANTAQAQTFAYIPNGVSNTVSVINIATNVVVATVPVEFNPTGVSVHPNGSRVYITNVGSPRVSVIDTANNTVVGTVLVGANPFGVAFNPAGTRAYVTRSSGNDLAVIDTASNTVITNVPVGSTPRGVAVNPAGTRAYVTNFNTSSSSVSVIDTASNTVVATILGLTNPSGIAVNPAGTRVFVANQGGGNVSVIDTASNGVVATVTVGTQPQAYGLFIGTPPAATAPGAPTIGTAAAGAGNATVSFTPPASNGGSAITGYRVTANPGGITATGTTSPITVTGLTAGTPYTFTVNAINAIGTGPASAASNSVTPSAPPPSPLAYITNQGSNNVSVIDTASNTVVVTVAVGNDPIGVAVNPAGTRAYVANFGSSNVSVIDTAINSVVATVAVGAIPRGIAVNPAGTRAYVTNQGGNNVSVINTASNSVVATVAVGSNPIGVAVNPAGTRAYVANFSGSSVSVINTATNTVVATVAVGNNAIGVAVNPAGTRAYVTNSVLAGNVSVIDTASNTVVATVVAGTSPIGVAVNPAGTRAFVANSGSNNVSVIDTASNLVVATVVVGTNPYGVAVNPAGTHAYVANQGSNNVSVIDTATNTVVATVVVGTAPDAFGLFIGTPPSATLPGAPTIGPATAGVGNASVSFTPPASNGGSAITGYLVTANPGGITATGAGSPITVTGLTGGTPYTFTVNAINAIGTGPASASSNSVTPTAPPPSLFAYITNQGSNNVSVIDTATNTVVATVAVGNQPFGVAVNSAGTRAYVTNQSSNNVSVIDTAGNTVVATVAVGTNPRGVAVNPAGTRAYITNEGSSNVSVIDTAGNSAVATVAVGTSPHGVAVDPTGTRAFVANSGSNNVSVIDTASNTVVATVAVGSFPYGIAVDPAGTRAYVTNRLSNSVSVIDTASNTVIATVVAGSDTIGIAVNPAGTRAYATNIASNNVTVIDTATNSVVATVAAGTQPIGVAINSAGTLAYVANAGSNSVSVIDTTTNTVVATVAVGTNPTAFGLFIRTPLSATVPGAPTIVTATAGVGSATVSFTPPASNGGSAITGYRVTSNPGTVVANGAASPITVPGLTAGVAYTFTVSAINAIGTGPASASSNSVTPTAATVTVTPSAGANGTINPATPQSITPGATAIFTVTPAAGYSAAVGGTCGGSLVGNTYTTAIVTAPCTVVATFTLIPPNTFVLSVVTSGAGSVSSSPAGIACPGDCTEPYNSGTVVTLTASASAGSIFTGWSGACSGTGTCSVSMSAARSVTANFGVAPAVSNIVTVTSSSNPSAYRASIVLSANIAGADPGGSVSFELSTVAGSLKLCDVVPVVASRAICPVPPSLNVTSPMFYIVTYSGDANNSGSTVFHRQLVNTNSATLHVIAVPVQPVVGGSTVLRATVAAENIANKVTFFENGAAMPGCASVAVARLPGAADIGVATCTVNALGAGLHNYVVVYPHVNDAGFEQLVVPVTPVAAATTDYTDMWWAGIGENGWGLSITQHGPIQFIVIYTYDAAGKPLWYVMPTGAWNATNTAYTGALYQPTSAPFGNYDARDFRIGGATGASVGSATVTYSGPATATLTYTINGISGSKAIVRQIFGGDDGLAKLQVNDLWWAGIEQNGWGMNIAQQGRVLFPVWYTYDSSGRTIFYAVLGGTWSGGSFTGDIYSTASSAWLGANYDRSKFVPTKVGTMTIDFGDQSNAVMTYTVNGVMQRKAIVRQPY